MATTPIEISDISTDDAEVTTDGNHGLVDDDIIRLGESDSSKGHQWMT